MVSAKVQPVDDALDDDDDDDDVEGAGEDRDEAQLKNRAEARSDDGACASVIIL